MTTPHTPPSRDVFNSSESCYRCRLSAPSVSPTDRQTSGIGAAQMASKPYAVGGQAFLQISALGSDRFRAAAR
ncbi:MAG: hypothetical protein MJA27_03330 [Pseudanabaenales cyanobacterium]|nr:hypothetical protein [Pseudanabaenales cyanobacterium]